LLVNTRFYRLLCETDSRFDFIERDCPACHRSHRICETLEIPAQIKHWSQFPGVEFKHCQDCDCVWKLLTPNDDMLSFLYRYFYRSSAPPDAHFVKEFGDVNLLGNTLELGGGGKGGVSNHVQQDDYFDIDACNGNAIVKGSSIVSEWDNVVACDVIEHVLNPNDLFTLANDVLTGEGRFYFTVGQQHPIHILPEMMQVPHITSFSQKTIEFMLEQHGFRGERVGDAGWIVRRY